MLNLLQDFYEEPDESGGGGGGEPSGDLAWAGMAQLSDDYKHDEQISALGSFNGLAKAYKDALGNQREPLPETYDLGDDFAIDEGIEYDLEDHKASVAEMAKELGLNNDQAKALSKYVLEADLENIRVDNQTKEEKAKEATARKEACTESLKKEWGEDKYDGNMKLLALAASTFWGEEFAGVIEEAGYGNSPEFMKGLVAIGEGMSEKELIVGDAPGKLDNADPRPAAEQADAIYGDTTPEKGANHPDNISRNDRNAIGA